MLPSFSFAAGTGAPPAGLVVDPVGTYSSGTSATTHRLVDYTLNGGGNRVLFVGVVLEGGSINSVVLDPDSAAIGLTADVFAANTNHIRWFRVLEASLPVGGDYDIEVTLSDPRSCAFVVWSASAAAQQALENTDTDTGADASTSLSIVVDADDVGGQIIGGGAINAAASDVWAASGGYDAEDMNFQTTNGQWRAVFAHGAADTATTETCTMSEDTAGRHAHAGGIISPA